MHASVRTVRAGLDAGPREPGSRMRGLPEAQSRTGTATRPVAGAAGRPPMRRGRRPRPGQSAATRRQHVGVGDRPDRAASRRPRPGCRCVSHQPSLRRRSRAASTASLTAGAVGEPGDHDAGPAAGARRTGPAAGRRARSVGRHRRPPTHDAAEPERAGPRRQPGRRGAVDRPARPGVVSQRVVSPTTARHDTSSKGLTHASPHCSPRTVEVSAHCDLPCGVYDPAQARIEAESIKAIIEKVADNDDPDFRTRRRS